MKIKFSRDEIITPLSFLSTVSTDKNTNFPIVANILILAKDNKIYLMGSDLELELSIILENTRIEVEGEVTIPSRKFFDIIRNCDDGADICLECKNNKANIIIGKSKFVLSTLPAIEFPRLDLTDCSYEFDISTATLRECIESTAFCMGSKDVRFYLNGMLIELSDNMIKSVTTDGHRLAYYENDSIELQNPLPDKAKLQFLLPRKTTSDVLKLLSDNDDELLNIQISSSKVKFSFANSFLTSKLINSKFPEYSRVIPKETNLSIAINRDELKNALNRAAILSSEIFKAVRLDFSENKLLLSMHNTEHEESTEDLLINYSGIDFTIGFNIRYVIDCLSNITDNNIIFNFTESHNSCIIHGETNEIPLYVIMPMRL